MLDCDNDAVLGFLRSDATEAVLVVANLAATARSATLTLPDSIASGRVLHDVFGGAPLGTVSAEGTVALTLGTREFFWLEVRPS